MKKLLILIIMGLIIIGSAAAQTVGSTMYVSVKSAALKSSTGFFASTRGTLNYGDRVTVLEVSGRFIRVRSANSTLEGWTPSANLSARQIVPGNTSTLSATETALAGKGFNQEVESAFRARGGAGNYADVDAVERVAVTEDGLRRFIEEGRLSMGDN